jgi:hypothetical protein
VRGQERDGREGGGEGEACCGLGERFDKQGADCFLGEQGGGGCLRRRERNERGAAYFGDYCGRNGGGGEGVEGGWRLGIGLGRETLRREGGAECEQGAVKSLLGGFERDMGGTGDFFERKVMGVTKENGIALVRGELEERAIEVCFGIGCGRWSYGWILHGGELLLAPIAVALDAQGILAGIVGDFVKPAGEGFVGRKFAGALGEDDEDGLRDIVGEMAVAEDAAGGRVDEGQVALDELAESRLGAGFSELAEKFVVGRRRMDAGSHL